jgi:N-acetyl-anhydromuramyl-L-alanine amidase AmpD
VLYVAIRLVTDFDNVNGNAQPRALFLLQHIQEQYTEMEPLLASLVEAYPHIIKRSYVSHAAYMWAVQVIIFAFQLEL